MVCGSQGQDGQTDELAFKCLNDVRERADWNRSPDFLQMTLPKRLIRSMVGRWQATGWPLSHAVRTSSV